MKTLVEVCVDSVEGAFAAQEGGADRVELCADLPAGGTTPSVGAIIATRARVGLGLVVLVRPRPGDFLYSEAELDVMRRDVLAAREAGADGVAVGVLTVDGDLDRERMAELIEVARPMQVTCHRAIDVARDPLAALDTLLELGVERVLSSGQAVTAPEGEGVLRALVERAAGRLAVMAGSGVREDNVRALVDATGVPEVHFSAGAVVPSPMRHRNERCPMGGGGPGGAHSEFERRVTDASVVRRTIAALAEGGTQIGGRA